MTLFTQKDLRAARLERTSDLRLPRRFDILFSRARLSKAIAGRLLSVVERMGFTAGLVEELGEATALLGRARCLLHLAEDESDVDVNAAWLLGYAEARGKRVGICPVLRKDSNRIDFPGEGMLARYPYIAYARAVDEDDDTLWALRDPKSHINLRFWLGSRTENW